MKKFAVTYTYHEHLASLDALKAVAYFEVEKPFRFNAVKSTHQGHIAMIVYWIAAAHNRYILRDDQILNVALV